MKEVSTTATDNQHKTEHKSQKIYFCSTSDTENVRRMQTEAKKTKSERAEKFHNLSREKSRMRKCCAKCDASDVSLDCRTQHNISSPFFEEKCNQFSFANIFHASQTSKNFLAVHSCDSFEILLAVNLKHF